jgi:hypothetical protein
LSHAIKHTRKQRGTEAKDGADGEEVPAVRLHSGRDYTGIRYQVSGVRYQVSGVREGGRTRGWCELVEE